MAYVNITKLALQTGSDNLYYATWTFNEDKKSTSTTVKKGDLVTIKSGATYYNGVSIPSWVMKDSWYVTQVSGSRAVLGKNKSGSNNIQSPINTKYLTGGSGSSSSSSSSKTLDHYEVKWTYATGDGIAFKGSEDTNVTDKQSTYSPPSNATKVKVGIKPVSKKYKKSGKETSYWSGEWKYKELNLSTIPPEDLSTPSVKIEKYQLTATIDNVQDARTDKIQFQVYEGDTKYATSTVTVATQRASYSCTVKAGGKYRVRCRAINMNDTTEVPGEWSPYSSEISTIPASVTNVVAKADTKTSVKVTWDAAGTATGYDIQYTTDKKYFDTTSVSLSSVENSTTAYITGLDSGDEWFFRVRAKNTEGESGWSDIVSTVIGTKPEPPTTWSLTTTAVVGDEVTLYWVHNAEDGSYMTESQIRMEINGEFDNITVTGSAPEEEAEPTYSYAFSTSDYTEGAEILWKIRTRGIHDDYSEWSTQRKINVYAPPVLEVVTSTNEDEILETFPLDISVNAEPTTQTPVSYYVAITAKDSYETEDVVGNTVFITTGTELYSKVFISSDHEFELSLTAGDVLLESGRTYDLIITVAMDSGLTAANTTTFTVDWEEYAYSPDASIGIDFDSLTAYISPYCNDEEENLVEDILLSVYRREYNGSFTLLASEIQNSGVDTITDPHPSLDYARYRIVAQHTGTGSISYEDLPGEPIGEPSIVMQWDEKWSNFDYIGEAEMEDKPWTGSMVRLPYNVDVTENYDTDVSLIEYIGRQNPVSYFGTQRGESATWNTVIDREDKETLFALRRLAAWTGNVYVREPSGIGYWAQVKVSLSTKHLDLTIPVSLSISRVEGGSV